MGVSKNMKKATESVITVWRFEGTTLIEKAMVLIDKNKEEFLKSGQRQAYRDASSNLTTIRLEVLKKANMIPLPNAGADLNNLVTVSYLAACVMNNGYRGLNGDDSLAGLESTQK